MQAKFPTCGGLFFICGSISVCYKDLQYDDLSCLPVKLILHIHFASGTFYSKIILW